MAAVVGSLRADLSASAARFEEDLGKAAKAVEAFARRAGKAGDTLERAGTRMAAAITLPLAALAGTSIKSAGDYEAAMNRVKAATLGTEKEMDALAKKAREVGKDMGNTANATQAAEGMEILAKNGLNVTQILDGALDASLKLAAATRAELAPAADVATDVMLQFGKGAKELDGVVDGITGTLLASKFGFDDYRLALGQAGGVAGGLGVPFEEFNAVIAGTSALFASGSDAGTSYKTFLASLPGISGPAAKAIEKFGLQFYNADGSMKTMVEITDELTRGLGGLNEKAKTDALQQIFGRDAMRTAIGLMAVGSDELQRLQDEIKNASAQGQMDALLTGWNGMLTKLGKAFTELKIRIAESGILDFATKMGLALTDLVLKASTLPDWVINAGVAFGALAAAIGPALIAAGAILNALSGLGPVAALVMTHLPAIASFAAQAAAMVARLAIGFNPLTAAIGFVVLSLVKFRGIFSEVFAQAGIIFQQTLQPAIARLVEAFKGMFAMFEGAKAGPLGEFVTFVQWVVAEIAGFFMIGLVQVVSRAVSMVIDLVAGIAKHLGLVVKMVGQILTGDFKGAFQSGVDIIKNFADTFLNILENIFPGIKGFVHGVVNWLGNVLTAGVGKALGWIEKRFPGLVSAMSAAATGVVNWAKWLYTSVKTWINDKFGPVIQWARNRLRELNSLWAKIKNRQADLKGEKAEAPAPDDAGSDTPSPSSGGSNASTPATPASTSSGGGGSGRSGKSEAQSAAEKLRDTLEDVDDSIDKAFARNRIPRSAQMAKDLRDKLKEVEAEARAAGTNMTEFAGKIALANQRINEMEAELAAREAREFARDVQALTRSVNDFTGSQTPMQRALDDVAERHQNIRDRIVEQIEENRVLADTNAEAAASMKLLEDQLKRLDDAYDKATEAAKAMVETQEKIRQLRHDQDVADLREDIATAERDSGRAPRRSNYAEEMAGYERRLDEERRAAQIRLHELSLEHMEAVANGDMDEAKRLEERIALQQKLHDIVQDTTAGQLRQQKNTGEALDRFEAGFSDLLTESIETWSWDWDNFFQLWRDLGTDVFIKPINEEIAAMFRNVLQDILGGIGSGGGEGSFLSGLFKGGGDGGGGFLSGLFKGGGSGGGSGGGGWMAGFEGFYADGGRMRGNKWAVVGEQGPELIRSGAGGLTVYPDVPEPSGSSVNFYVTTPNADSFNRNQRQTGRLARMSLGM